VLHQLSAFFYRTISQASSGYVVTETNKSKCGNETFSQLLGSTVLAVGLVVLGLGFMQMSNTEIKFLPELAATRKDVKHLHAYIDNLTNKAPAVAGSTGEAAGEGLVKGAVDGAKAEAP
jgi:hypothetical protein